MLYLEDVSGALGVGSAIGMPIPRQYKGSNSTTPLSPDAEAALSFLDEIVNGNEATATIYEDGTLHTVIQTDGFSGLGIWAGDGGGSVNYSGGPTRTSYFWRWDSQTTPGELHALLDGRAVERIRLLGRRRLTGELVIEGRTVAHSGRLRRPLAALLRRPQRELPVDPYVAPAYGDEIFMRAPLGHDWIVVMRRNLSDRPIEWYLQHWNHDLSELASESQFPTEGQAVVDAALSARPAGVGRSVEQPARRSGPLPKPA